MDAPERLALLVLADAVELEPGKAAKEETASARRLAAGVGEEPLDVDEPRVDEERLGPRELDLDALQRELVEGLAVLGIREPQVTVAVVEEFERPASGKLRRFVPLVTAGT